jgi:hypothetical protein
MPVETATPLAEKIMGSVFKISEGIINRGLCLQRV